MGKKFRRLEPYGYLEQPSFEGIENSVRQNINEIVETNNQQEKEIDSKTIKITASPDGTKYIVTQGGKKIGEIEVNTLVDHAEVITVGEKQVLRLYFDEAGTKYVDIDLTDLKESYSFNNSYTVTFDTTEDGQTTNVTAKVERLAYNDVDGNVPFVENGKIYDSNGNEVISVSVGNDGKSTVGVSADKMSLGEIDDLESTIKSIEVGDVWKPSETPGIRAEMWNTAGDKVIAKMSDEGEMYLLIEGEMLNINDLLGQLAHETYEGDGNSTYAP